MKWNKVSECYPPNTNEVLVSDGEGSYAVAWCRLSDRTWHVASDLIEAFNYDDGCSLYINDDEVKYWTEIIDVNID